MKIFIYLPNWLGDAAMSLPAINLLKKRYEQAVFVFYGSGAALSLVEGFGQILLENKRERFKQFLELRSEKFDLVINFKASNSSRLCCMILRAKKRLFFRPQKRLQVHQVYKYAKLLKPCGIELCALLPLAPARFYFLKSSISAPERQCEQIRQLFCEKLPAPETAAATAGENLLFLQIPAPAQLRQNLLKNCFKAPRARQILAIAPGAAYGSAKSYEDFAALARLIAPNFAYILLLGGPAEMPAAQALEQDLCAEFCVKNLCGKTSLKRLQAAISCASLVLCNDSGVMHLCAMLQRPSVSVFGATNAAQTAAYSALAMIFSTLADCSPCKKRECPKKHHLCMKNCRAEQIAAVLKAEFFNKNYHLEQNFLKLLEK